MATSKRRLLVTLSEGDEAKVEELRVALGYRWQSQVLRKALRELHKAKVKP